MSAKKWASAGLVVALLGGYATLDTFDVAPGVLTLERGNEPRTVTHDGTTYEPVRGVSSAPALPAAANGPAPSADAVKRSVETSLKSTWLGPTTAVTVRDADTGEVLYEHDSNKATTPASVTKLASAFAVAHSDLPLEKGLKTRTTLSGTTLTLVGGGDMVLAPGAGDGSKIAGHAGLGDLAASTAAQLKKRGLTSVTLDTNTSYADGPDTAKGWEEGFLSYGFTARISTLALADDRADNRTPAVADPTKNAADAFTRELAKRGIKATYGRNVKTATSGTELASVESAPVLDLLGLALQDSDNAMAESLARQAAAAEGVHGDSTVVGTWVTKKLKDEGVDVSGMKLADASGLSKGTTLPVRIIGDILSRATSGKDAKYAEVVSRLPVSAWNGTLHDRYTRTESEAGAGLVHAKTGSLRGVSSLAGELRTVGGHRLVFAVTTNGDFPEGPVGAKTAVDHLVAQLTTLK